MNQSNFKDINIKSSLIVFFLNDLIHFQKSILNKERKALLFERSWIFHKIVIYFYHIKSFNLINLLF